MAISGTAVKGRPTRKVGFKGNDVDPEHGSERQQPSSGKGRERNRPTAEFEAVTRLIAGIDSLVVTSPQQLDLRRRNKLQSSASTELLLINGLQKT